jgi:hypothetical protein
VRELYQEQLAVPGYERLVNSNVTIFGTIDGPSISRPPAEFGRTAYQSLSHLCFPSFTTPIDHDYGCNNADKNFLHKYETTNAFVDFLGEPEDSPMARRAAAGYGVYGVKMFDFDRPEGHYLVPESEACIDPDAYCVPMYSNKTVAVFVLDVRSNKDPWIEGSKAYYSNDYIGDFLGQSQWEWFERAISNSRAAVNVVVNGLQVNSDLFPNPNIAESWGYFPKAQQRLFAAVLNNTVAAPILISGDVHMTQLMRKDCRKRDDPHQQRPIMEMTTSGMTHSWGRIHTRLINKPNHGHSVLERVEALVGSVTMHIMHYVRPWTHLLVSSNDPEVTHDGGIEGAIQGLQYSLERNFGELEFDWEERTVTIRSIGEEAKPLLTSRVSMDQLSGRIPMSTFFVTEEEFRAETAEQHPLVANEWVCVDHRGRVSMARELIGQVNLAVSCLSIFSLPILIPAYFVGLLWQKRRSRRNHRDVARPASSVPASAFKKQISF